jgi:mRNA-degrading endonuclease RelE of RelBE toxin-antitoxin system
MDWDVRLADRAKRSFERMPAADRGRVEAALIAMKQNPYAGDTRPLQGRFEGAFRRRVGNWRIVFAIKSVSRIVLVADILRRTSATY